MKKSLLFGAALLCAASVNAQVYQMVAADHGITATDKNEAGSVEAGYVFFDGDAVTIANAFTTNHITTDCKCNNYNQVVVDGNVLITNGGIQGQDNPKDAEGSIAGGTLAAVPASGAVIEFTAKKDGYAYVFGKLSSNKNYYVFEEGTAAVFTLAMQVSSEAFPESIITYTAEGDEMGYLTDANWMNWPEKVALGEGWEAAAGEAGKIAVNGVGFIGFKVYEGCKYLVGAGGSKISWFGAYVADAPASSIVLQGTDEENPAEDFVLYKGEGGSDPVVEPTVLWTNDGTTGEVSWSGEYRFCNEENMTGEEIYAFPMYQWNYIKTNEFKVVVEGANPQIRVTTGWWDTTWGGDDIFPGNEKLADNGDGTYTLTVNFGDDPIIELLDSHHLLFTGSGYKVNSIYVDGEVSINSVKAEANAAVIFNLNGQKLNDAKGLMIRDGKVILVK